MALAGGADRDGYRNRCVRGGPALSSLFLSIKRIPLQDLMKLFELLRACEKTGDARHVPSRATLRKDLARVQSTHDCAIHDRALGPERSQERQQLSRVTVGGRDQRRSTDLSRFPDV